MSLLSLATTKPATTSADSLLVTITPGRGKKVVVHGAGITASQSTRIAEALQAVSATGKAGEITRVPSPTAIKASTIVAVGLGDRDADTDGEKLRRAIGSAVRGSTGQRKIAIVPPDTDDSTIADVAMAARLGAYAFTAFKSSDPATARPVRTVAILVPAPAGAARELIDRAETVAPPNALAPADLAQAAKDSVAGLPVTVKIWDEKALDKDNCGGILGVGKGSSRPPRLVRMTYAPRGATSHVALVGKGITFDTGGISIKPAANMDEMKADMSGAAAVIGAMRAIASLGLGVTVTGWVPAAENMPSGTAQRPGDVLTTYSGTTVEVLNTDAEGRLVLADALGMAVEENPDLIVDVATLTGAQRIALGSRTAGVMANNDDARTQVIDAANAAGEAMWPMPLPEDLRGSLDSATADIANIGDRLGGMLSAGIFLSEFIPADQPWVHIDIAGPAFNEKSAYGYTPKGGTGAAVRTFVELVEDFTRD
ncbi:MAG: leucyl aminopeptidase [Actinobacteria bacterium]|nr:leucyl aminopeptidase [Actinomycetota bacterium]